MDAIARIALTAGALLCSRGDARVAAADVVRTPAPPQEPVLVDAWFGDDKFRHFAVSFAATAFTFAAARSAGADDAALPAAITVAAAAGVGKELYDRRSGRIFSTRDLVWDALGVLAGYAFLRNID